MQLYLVRSQHQPAEASTSQQQHLGQQRRGQPGRLVAGAQGPAAAAAAGKGAYWERRQRRRGRRRDASSAAMQRVAGEEGQGRGDADGVHLPQHARIWGRRSRGHAAKGLWRRRGCPHQLPPQVLVIIAVVITAGAAAVRVAAMASSGSSSSASSAGSAGRRGARVERGARAMPEVRSGKRLALARDGLKKGGYVAEDEKKNAGV